MKTYPKITPSLINSYSRADSIDVIFPRGEHPDTRTNVQFLRDLENKFFKKQYVEKVIKSLKRYPNRKPIMCLNTGEIYEGINIAERILGISNGNIRRQINGDYTHVKGLRFKYL